MRPGSEIVAQFFHSFQVDRIMYKIIAWSACAALTMIWSNPLLADSCPSEISQYTIAPMAGEKLKVTLEHELRSDKLYIMPKSSQSGMSLDEFISNARLSTSEGEAYEISSSGKGKWEIDDAPKGERIKLEYDLNMSHGDHKWNMGGEEIGFAFNGGFYLVARTMLLADFNAADCPTRIKFNFKNVSAPFKQVSENNFEAPSLKELWNNAYAFGDKFGIRSIEPSKDTKIDFVYDEKSADLAQQASKDIKPILEHLTKLFGGMPAQNYNIYLWSGEHTEGGAFDNSFAMLHPSPVKSLDALIWRHGFVHELIHLWVGHGIRQANNSDIEWFKEGVTDYLALKTLWKLGYLTETQLSEKLANIMRRHTMGLWMSQGKVQLTSAGSDKNKNKMIIYGSGAVFALFMDVHMDSNVGSGSFELMLRSLYEESGKAYTKERLIASLDKHSDGFASQLLAKLDKGMMPTEFANYLNPYGIELSLMMPDMFYLDLSSSGDKSIKSLFSKD